MTDASPRTTARIAGVLYLIIIVAALFAQIGVRSAMIVSGNPTATATNILASEGLYRLGVMADLVTVACDVAVAALLYRLLKPVGPALALTAGLLRIVAATVTAAVAMFAFTPLILLKGGAGDGFSSGQLQDLAMAAMRMRETGYVVSLLIFGLHCLLLGWLVFRSRFLPRVLGLMLGVAGLCYLVSSGASLIAPAFAGPLYPFILLPCFVAELALTIWLISVGVNARVWRLRNAAAD